MMMRNDVNFIGVSLSNPYYTKDDVRQKIHIDFEKYDLNHKIVFFDKPFLQTLEALGYEGNEAQKKLKNKVSYTKNKIIKNFSTPIGSNISTDKGIEHTFIDRENEVSNNIDYLEMRQAVGDLYLTNKVVKDTIDIETETVLQGLARHYNKTEKFADGFPKEVIQTASQYILDELSFFFSAYKLFEKEHANLIYHKDWELIDKVKKHMPPSLTEHFSFLTFKNVDDNYHKKIY